MTSVENLELLEDRVRRLEDLVGRFEKIDETKGLQTINDLSSKLSDYSTTNAKIFNTFKLLNDIKRYTNFEALNEIEDETLIKAKIELILSEEENLRIINTHFTKLSTLSKILDNPDLNDVPKLLEKLKDLCSKQANIKSNEQNLGDELKNFLSVYYNSMKSINGTLVNLNDYLEQFESPKANGVDD